MDGMGTRTRGWPWDRRLATNQCALVCCLSFSDQCQEHTQFRGWARQRKSEARGIRTPNLLNWSQTRCRCAIALALPPSSLLL